MTKVYWLVFAVILTTGSVSNSSTTESVTQRSSTESEIILASTLSGTETAEFTPMIPFCLVIGSLIGSAFTVLVLLIIGCLKAMRARRRPDNSDARGSLQIYLGVTEQQRENAVYEAVGGNDYEEPIAAR